MSTSIRNCLVPITTSVTTFGIAFNSFSSPKSDMEPVLLLATIFINSSSKVLKYSSIQSSLETVLNPKLLNLKFTLSSRIAFVPEVITLLVLVGSLWAR